MATRMQQRRGTAAQWISTNSGNGPILNAGEIGYETDTNKFKIGDGTNHWVDLEYFLDAATLGGSIDDYIPLTQKDAASGVPSLDASKNLYVAGASIIVEGATDNSYETTLTVTDPTADRTITFPNATGTVVLADGSGNVTVSGDLTVSGTTTTINSTTINATTGIIFEGATADAFETTLTVTDPTADRTVTFQDATGTVVLRDSTDTLTNKSISLGSNTVTSTLAQLNTAVSDADVASLAGTETLTNKTIALGSNTVSGTIAQFNTAVTDADLATLAGTETLTNKTLTSPTLTTPALGVATATSVNGTTIPSSKTLVATDSTAYVVPSQTGNSGKYLTTDGTTSSWGSVSGYSAPTLGSTSIASGATVTTIAGLTLSGATLTGTSTVSGTGDFLISGDTNVRIVPAAGSNAYVGSLSADNIITTVANTQTLTNKTLSAPALTGNATAVNLTISGDLTVNGTTTNINSTSLVVEDKNVVLGDVATPTDTTADGGGITLKGATDKTFNWVDATDAWTSSEDMNLLTGKVYEIAGTTVLSGSTLGSGVTGSSLTSVGTLTTGTWSATTIALNKGGTGATTQAGAANAVLPSQTSASGKYLTSNGTDVSWATVSSYSAPTIGSTSIASGATVTTIAGLAKINSTATVFTDGSGYEVDRDTMLIMGAL